MTDRRPAATAQHRAVVVTGAGTGIGRAVAERLIADGARVALMGRRREPLEEVAGTHGDAATVIPVDVSDRPALHAAFDAAGAALGPIHAVIANAGIGGPNAPGDDDRWNSIIDINLTGAYETVRAFERVAAPGPDPRHAVVISSCLARFGVPGYTAYCASKAGLLGMVRAFAHELAEQNILINAICPGWVETVMARDGMKGMADAMGTSYEEARKMAMDAVPLGRISDPEEIAGTVAFLLSPDARSITGATLDQNAGSWM